MDSKQYAEKCFRDEAEAILNLIPQLTDDFNKAVDLILNCKGRFIVTGVGKSGHIGEKIAATLASTGTPSFFVNPLDAYHGDLGMFTPDDVVMAISYSGNTDELLRIIPLLLDRKIPIIGVTGGKDSILAKYSTYVLNIGVKREACPLNLAPTSSTTATAAMGDALACALEIARHFKPSDFALFHPGGSLGRKLLTRVKDVMKSENLPLIEKNKSVLETMFVISQAKMGLAIVQYKGKVLGIVTDGDIRREIQSKGKDGVDTVVADIMNPDPVVVRETDMVDRADKLMRKKKIHTLIVVNERQEPTGIITSYEII
jgi:arabinose-5-phosphate isomerase